MTTPGTPVERNDHSGYSNTHLGHNVVEIIRNYTPMLPKRLWNDVADFTRSAITDFAPANEREARRAMNAVARLSIWTTDVACQPLERHVVFNGRHIDTYIARGAPDGNDYGKRRRRLQLLNIAGELQQFDPERRDAGKKPARHLYAPYIPEQIVRLRSQGNTRSTALRRHNWLALLAFGAGCGLTSPEICDLTVDDVEISDVGVEVSVSGVHERTVTCLAEWEDDIRALVGSPLVDRHLFVAETRPRRPSTHVAIFIRDAANGREAFTTQRLRSTWIVGHLQNRVPPVDLINALGMTTFATLQRFIPFVAELGDEERTALFRRVARS